MSFKEIAESVKSDIEEIIALRKRIDELVENIKFKTDSAILNFTQFSNEYHISSELFIENINETVKYSSYMTYHHLDMEIDGYKVVGCLTDNGMLEAGFTKEEIEKFKKGENDA